MSAWSNDVILEFLEHYRTEQLLWDPRHPLHRNRSEVNEAWLRIQSSLSTAYSITDLKKKKESLMTSFRMHWHKKRKSNNDYRTTWFAFPLMESFLSEKYDCDSSTNDLEQEFFNNSEDFNETAVSDHQYTSTGRNERPLAKASRPPMPQPIEIKVNNAKNSEFIVRKQSEEAKTDKDGADEYDLYGQLLAKKLRKLDERQRDIAMHEIDNVMFRVKMQGSQAQVARSYSSSPSHGSRKVKSPLFIVAQQSHSQYEDESMVYEQDPMQGQPS